MCNHKTHKCQKTKEKPTGYMNIPIKINVSKEIQTIVAMK
jgi:hypothetical protein